VGIALTPDPSPTKWERGTTPGVPVRVVLTLIPPLIPLIPLPQVGEGNDRERLRNQWVESFRPEFFRVGVR